MSRSHRKTLDPVTAAGIESYEKPIQVSSRHLTICILPLFRYRSSSYIPPKSKTAFGVCIGASAARAQRSGVDRVHSGRGD
jgi:hypothetical protein